MIFTLTLNPCLDRYLYIDDLIEDDTVRVKKVSDYPAGKGIDVSRVINELGGHSVAIALLGGHTGQIIQKMLNEEGVVYASVFTHKETRVNTILQKGNTQYRMSLPGPEVSDEEERKIIKTIDTLLRQGDFLILSGSLAKGIKSSIYLEICKFAKKRGAKVYLDSDGKPLMLGIKCPPDGIKPNLHEFSRLYGKVPESHEELKDALIEVSKKYGINEILLTLGKDGALCYVDNSLYRVSVPEVPVKSAVGAGDSFLAAYCMYREAGKPIEEALRVAGAASSATVITPGTELCHKKDVEKLMKDVQVERL
ncbi:MULTISPECIES: 1-phosphofructokinase family hexose kinase [Kosmotoga]|jgi:6-phosphofructokinase 2|uniref:1-phosphofructokinase n=1 Tax=Kosmotoga olearia (strain ATCC BAA-1733 / DSM 21960 / TBF 19.5.1) TaxID=521045 RepID=C5CGC0_KOSOT|nr:MULTISPECIES: 1-phosphofructokinase family hexose kinase [Kosmotoga]ACR79561.1 1-phosphofructokinase [Kosmotoga olearia TBF 19.5.1]MDI3523925.1 6-phosphofructokinase 2 [Kosmotoga sp.]MDK2953296.1 6-phosphofructokinase 2 [Kosmotoga sp.]